MVVTYNNNNSRVCCLKKNLNVSRPSEHPPVRGKKMSTFLGDRIIGCKDKNSSWHLIGFPDGSNIGSSQYNVGEKPTVMVYLVLYTYNIK